MLWGMFDHGLKECRNLIGRQWLNLLVDLASLPIMPPILVAGLS